MESNVMEKTIEVGNRLAEIGTEVAAEASQIKGIVVEAFEEGLEVVRDTAKRTI